MKEFMKGLGYYFLCLILCFLMGFSLFVSLYFFTKASLLTILMFEIGFTFSLIFKTIIDFSVFGLFSIISKDFFKAANHFWNK